MSPDKKTVGDEVRLIGTVLLCVVLFSFIISPFIHGQAKLF